MVSWIGLRVLYCFRDRKNIINKRHSVWQGEKPIQDKNHRGSYQLLLLIYLPLNWNGRRWQQHQCHVLMGLPYRSRIFSMCLLDMEPSTMWESWPALVSLLNGWDYATYLCKLLSVQCSLSQFFLLVSFIYSLCFGRNIQDPLFLNIRIDLVDEQN